MTAVRRQQAPPSGDAPASHRSGGRARAWLRELLLGARMSLAGGASGWVRAGLTSLGVGLGVAMLLAAASAPHAIAAGYARQALRDTVNFSAPPPPASDATILVAYTRTDFGDQTIRGIFLQPDGAHPPMPPGLTQIPGPGEMAVSPALARLLASTDAAVLRERLDYAVVATIGAQGLVGPQELAFYVGADSLDEKSDQVVRRAGFAEPPWLDGPDATVSLIIAVVVVVLLLPVGVFVAAATRFGGEARDRRLAGVRLLGADARMARRIAAGEALALSAFGLLVGVAIFLVVRSVADRFEVFGFSAFPSDVQPDAALTALLAAGVPAAAVLVTLLSMRRVVIEPLGVTRRAADTRRRLWWRLLLPAAGVALLLPLVGALRRADPRVSEEQVGAGVTLVLVGVAVLLPWVVQTAVRWLRGGPVAWQLAVRRLQLDPGTSARAVMGIAVAVAGAIGLQTVITSTQGRYVVETGLDPSRADARVLVRVTGGWDSVRAAEDRFRSTRGIIDVHSRVLLDATFPAAPGHPVGPGELYVTLTIADCAAIRLMAETGSCAEGDVFLIAPTDANGLSPVPAPGTSVLVGASPGEPARATGEWTVPNDARMVPGRSDTVYGTPSGLLATPSALPDELVVGRPAQVDATVRLDHRDPDALERLRTAAWLVDTGGFVYEIEATVDGFAQTRRALFAGVAVTLVLIATSLLVATLEQLRERRRVLASLVAFGARRRTLAWSVLWQAVIPVAFGMLIAVAAGTGVGALLLRIAGQPVIIDWASTGLAAGIAAAVVLSVTSLSIPVLWRLMRADGLRTE
jgi:hypothetical protein